MGGGHTAGHSLPLLPACGDRFADRPGNGEVGRRRGGSGCGDGGGCVAMVTNVVAREQGAAGAAAALVEGRAALGKPTALRAATQVGGATPRPQRAHAPRAVAGRRTTGGCRCRGLRDRPACSTPGGSNKTRLPSGGAREGGEDIEKKSGRRPTAQRSTGDKQKRRTHRHDLMRPPQTWVPTR